MSKTCYAHANGYDSVGFWYSAASGGVVSAPVSGDTLDTNGYAVAAGAAYFGTGGSTYTIVDSAVTHGYISFSSVENRGLIICSSGGDVRFSNYFQNQGSIVCESGGSVALNSSDNRGSIVCKSGGSVTLNSGDNCGSVVCESGGSVTLAEGVRNRGSVVCESGGSIILDYYENQGSIVCESGGSVSLLSNSNSYGAIVCESGGNLVVTDTDVGTDFLYYLGANITGATGTSLGVERRTAHFTGSLSDQITICGTSAVFDLVGGEVSMRHCRPSRKWPPA